jgi:hypothetical protein
LENTKEEDMKSLNHKGGLFAAILGLAFLIGAPFALAEKYDGVTVTFDKPIA